MPFITTAVSGRNGLQENRVPTSRVPPRMILTRKFPDSFDMELGETGQIDVVLEADGGEIFFDGVNDIKNTNFKVISIKKINVFNSRI